MGFGRGVLLWILGVPIPIIILLGTSKNRRFPPPRKSNSRLSCSERGRLAWDSLASSI